MTTDRRSGRAGRLGLGRFGLLAGRACAAWERPARRLRAAGSAAWPAFAAGFRVDVRRFGAAGSDPLRPGRHRPPAAPDPDFAAGLRVDVRRFGAAGSVDLGSRWPLGLCAARTSGVAGALDRDLIDR